MTNQMLENFGLLGVCFYLASYAMLQMGMLKGNGYTYVVMNLIAASLVLISLHASFNMSSAIIQIFWIVISIFGIGRLIWLNARISFTAEEAHLLKLLFPTMDKALARKFLDIALWFDLDEGSKLTVEDTPVNQMVYVLSGSAEVTSQGQKIGEIREGLVGEVNVLAGGNASATVTISEMSRVLVFPALPLRKLAKKDKEFGLALENVMKRETGEKLRRANQKLAERSRG